ncbi:class I SAM-dependent methyltransferase [Gordonia sp. X0973]|nr:class I SAM-dependent methyltransferase [Gordonia sp. X0973]
MPDHRVRDAYSRRAREYIDLFGSIDSTAEVDRALLLGWSRTLTGRVLDVGCGPGQWTAFLKAAGVDAVGVDPVPEFIDQARSSHPDVEFRLGRASSLDEPSGGVGGILAWFSLIHSTPADVDVALREFARCLRAGGGLAVGYFAGPALAPFDHAVTTAYFWPPDLLAEHLGAAGFQIADSTVRSEAGARSVGTIIAERIDS